MHTPLKMIKKTRYYFSLSLAVHKCWGFGQERGDYPQIRGGKKNWISVLPPYSPPFPQNHKNLFPCYQMLTSLLGVRSSLFSSCPLPLLRSPLLPSRCSPPPPRCNASTLRMPAALNCLTFLLAVCFCGVFKECAIRYIVAGSWKGAIYFG